MKAKMMKWLGIGLIVCLGSVQVRAQGLTTNEVQGLKFSGSGVTQLGTEEAPLIGSVKITEAALINLAKGRAKDAAVPANEKLALVIPHDDGQIEIGVIDTLTTNFVSIASGATGDEVIGPKGGVVIVAMNVQNVGVPANRILGGELYLSVAFTQAGEAPLSKLKASVIGVVHTTMDSEDSTVLITTGKLSSTGLIFLVVESPI